LPGAKEFVSPLSISIVNQQERLELDYQRMKAVGRAVLEGEGVKKAKVTIACMTDEAIAALNQRFLQHDGPTDVISFPYSQSKNNLQAELAVSTDMAYAIASQRNRSPTDELLLYLIHGILHLCGYDDLDDRAQTEMRARERHYLQLLKIDVEPVDSKK
jgi:probable rRNA maturation factor